jgi:ketosteroid isomerase-like protein
MSQENVDVVRRAVASALDRRFDPEFWAENIEWQAAPEEPDVGVAQGRKAVERAVIDWFDHLGSVRIEIEDLIDAGDDVLVCARLYWEGSQTGFPGYHLYSVANRKVVRVRAFLHRDEAIEAAGLSE